MIFIKNRDIIKGALSNYHISFITTLISRYIGKLLIRIYGDVELCMTVSALNTVLRIINITGSLVSLFLVYYHFATMTKSTYHIHNKKNCQLTFHTLWAKISKFIFSKAGLWAASIHDFYEHIWKGKVGIYTSTFLHIEMTNFSQVDNINVVSPKTPSISMVSTDSLSEWQIDTSWLINISSASVVQYQKRYTHRDKILITVLQLSFSQK